MSEDRLEALAARLKALEQRHERLAGYVVPALWDVIDRLYARTQAPSDVLACLACGQSAPRTGYGVRADECMFGGGTLVRHECPACGCVFGPEKYLDMSAKLVGLDMANLYATYQEGDSTEQEIAAFRMLDPEPGKLYLNWGSGAWSRSVEILRAEGFDVWGYEPHVVSPSPFVVRQRGEISARFDGIFSNNVLEHLIDPAAQFRDYRDILKPDGRMAHATPCFEYLYAFSRFHVFFPLGESIAKLAARTGFSLIGASQSDGFNARLFQA